MEFKGGRGIRGFAFYLPLRLHRCSVTPVQPTNVEELRKYLPSTDWSVVNYFRQLVRHHVINPAHLNRRFLLAQS